MTLVVDRPPHADPWPKDGVYRLKRYQKPRQRRGVYFQIVRPVDGEKHFNDVGRSHGFVHLADPKTGVCLGFCGVLYFERNATYLGTVSTYLGNVDEFS